MVSWLRLCLVVLTVICASYSVTAQYAILTFNTFDVNPLETSNCISVNGEHLWYVNQDGEGTETWGGIETFPASTDGNGLYTVTFTSADSTSCDFEGTSGANHDDFDIISVNLTIHSQDCVLTNPEALIAELGDGCCPDELVTPQLSVDFVFDCPSACIDSGCLQGSTCIEDADATDGYTCVCAAGYTGDMCNDQVKNPDLVEATLEVDFYGVYVDTHCIAINNEMLWPSLTGFGVLSESSWQVSDTVNLPENIIDGSYDVVVYYGTDYDCDVANILNEDHDDFVINDMTLTVNTQACVLLNTDVKGAYLGDNVEDRVPSVMFEFSCNEPCANHDCVSGATCVVNDLNTEYRCMCPSDYTGDTCSELISDSSSSSSTGDGASSSDGTASSPGMDTSSNAGDTSSSEGDSSSSSDDSMPETSSPSNGGGEDTTDDRTYTSQTSIKTFTFEDTQDSSSIASTVIPTIACSFIAVSCTFLLILF